MSLNIHGKPLTVIGFQQLTSFNTAAVKLSVPAGCTHIYWEAHFSTAPVLDATEPDTIVTWRDDGTDPTATVGMALVQLGNAGFYPGDPEEASRKLRVIGRLAESVLNVTYYKA